jgi:glutamate dehydrogenase (NADP+)
MKTLEDLMRALREREPHVPLFHQAAEAMARSVWPVLEEHPEWRQLCVFERLLVPDRELRFRVDWVDDEGAIHTEVGWRIQHSDLLGPYKGGLRFGPDVDRSALRFLAYEQTFKGALTGLPLGGAKGGATFDPHGRSEGEVMRFCQAFMGHLAGHVGPTLDVPAGDMNVGARELGYLYGAYRRYRTTGRGALTGKPVSAGGIPLRIEATGFGLIYAVEASLDWAHDSLEGKRVTISGAGNVALHAARKALEMGGRVLTLSDTEGTAHWADGLSNEALDAVVAAKAEGRHLHEVVCDLGATTSEGTPWGIETDIALPCATQNELDDDDARALVDGGVLLVGEGANMPCTAEATAYFTEAGVARLPGKLANAGGVSVSSFEMAQNAQLEPWSSEHVDQKLRDRMHAIHERCVEYGRDDGDVVDYERGANVASFLRLAEAMMAQGVI